MPVKVSRMPRSIIRSKLFSPLAELKPVAVRAGEFLFISGQTPHDPTSGELVTSIDQIRQRAKGRLDFSAYESLFDQVIPGPVAAQTFTVLANMEGILAENQMSLEHVVKVNIYLTDFQNLTAFRRIWRTFFPVPTTACSIVGISTAGMNPNVLVTLDCMAVLPEKIPVENILRIPSEGIHVGLGCAAVKAGDLIFVSGHVGSDREGRPILKCKDVGKDAKKLIETIPMATPRTEATVAQMWSINEQINGLLERIGSSGDNILIQNYFVKSMAYDFFNVLPVNRIFYPKFPPAATGFGYPAVSGSNECNVQVEVVATVPGRKEALDFGPELTRPTTHYTMATKSGPYIFLSGRAGINWQQNGAPVVTAKDLSSWNGQHIMVGRLDQEKPVFVQAWYCYEAIRRIVEQVGASLEDVAKTNIYLMNVDDLPLVERARNYFFKDLPPAETVIPISQCTMHRELVVEVEPIVVMRA